MSEHRIIQQIYMARVIGEVGRRRPHRTFTDQILDVLGLNIRASMNVVDTRVVCHDCTKCRSVVLPTRDGRYQDTDTQVSIPRYRRHFFTLLSYQTILRYLFIKISIFLIL